MLYTETSPVHIEGLVQDCSNSIANALESLQSCTKPRLYGALCSHFVISPYVAIPLYQLFV